MCRALQKVLSQVKPLFSLSLENFSETEVKTLQPLGMSFARYTTLCHPRYSTERIWCSQNGHRWSRRGCVQCFFTNKAGEIVSYVSWVCGACDELWYSKEKKDSPTIGLSHISYDERYCTRTDFFNLWNINKIKIEWKATILISIYRRLL